jgi:membrane-associated phospholipid phosphatase
MLTRGGALWIACSILLRTSGNDRGRRAANDGLIAWTTSEAVTFALKRVLGRPRPTLAGSGPTPSSTSVPSSHTASAVAYSIAAGARLPAAALPLGTIATAVAWSRLATQRHFPSDVLVGALIGTAVGGSVARIRGDGFTNLPRGYGAPHAEHAPERRE